MGPSPVAAATAAPASIPEVIRPTGCGDACERAVAERFPAELRGRRLAEHHAARRLEAPDKRGVSVRHPVLEDERADMVLTPLV
jgi:hypothetical protein